MAIDELKILRELEAKNIGKNPKETYTNFLTELADDIVKEFKDYTKSNTKGSGALEQSYTAKPSKDGFEIEADFYYKFIDEGVNASPKRSDLSYTRPLVTSSPYSFKHLRVGKGMFDSIRSIVGGGAEQVYSVAVSIKKHGIRPKEITENVITDKLLERISEDLATLTGLAIEVVFDKNTNTQ